MKRKRNCNIGIFATLSLVVLWLFPFQGCSYALSDISIKEDLSGISVLTSFYNMRLSRANNYTISNFSLNKGSGNTLIEKIGLSYLPIGKSKYRTEYGFGMFETDQHNVVKDNDRIRLTFSSRNKDLSITKTYIVYNDAPVCELQYDITILNTLQLGPASLANIFFPLHLNTIVYLDSSGSSHKISIALSNGKIYDPKRPNYLQGKHFPKRWHAMVDDNTNEGIAILFGTFPAGMTLEAAPRREHNRYVLDFIYNDYSRILNLDAGTNLTVKYYLVPFSTDMPSIQAYVEGVAQKHLKSEISLIPEDKKPERSVIKLGDWEHFSLWAEQSTRKVFTEPIDLHKHKVISDKLHLSGAAGESVSFQLVFSGKEEAQKLKLKFSELAGPPGHLIADDNISSEQVAYIYLKDLYTDGRVGLTPDPLIPKNVFNVEINKILPVFVKIKIPRTAIPGNYTGKLTINAESDYEISYTLTVWNFELPTTPTLKTAFELYVSELLQTGSGKGRLKAYLENAFTHRISIPNIGHVQIEKRKGKLIIDTTHFDTVATYTLDELGMNILFMPHVLFGVKNEPLTFFEETPGTPAWKNLMDQYLTYMVKHINERGWHDKLLYFIWDEPTNVKSTWKTIRETSSFITSYDPEAKIYVSTPFEVIKQVKDVDRRISAAVFAAIMDDLEAKTYPGKWLSLDGVCGDWISAPLLKPRLVPWIAWAHQLEGLELWAINLWNDEQFSNDQFSFDDNPFEYSRTSVSAARFGGVLLYPGSNSNPLNSLRWESLNDGMEDYEYLHALNKKLSEWDQENSKPPFALENELDNAKRLLEEIRTIIYARKDRPPTLQQILDFRDRLGELNSCIPYPVVD